MVLRGLLWLCIAGGYLLCVVCVCWRGWLRFGSVLFLCGTPAHAWFRGSHPFRPNSLPTRLSNHETAAKHKKTQ